jgi:hypothetical protein
MTPSRRDFLIGCGAGAAAWATLGLLPGEFLVSRVDAAELSPEKRGELASLALDTAKLLGASYADIRINRSGQTARKQRGCRLRPHRVRLTNSSLGASPPRWLIRRIGPPDELR